MEFTMTSKGMAPTSTRSLWKGAISFGLLHIPVALYSATSENKLEFDWLDKRTMDPVGYKRYNKKSGKEVAMSDIVKGIEYDEGRYVLLSKEEIEAAYPKITQTLEIESFISTDEVPFVYLEKPYYTAPINRGDRVYALLRDTLAQTDKVGVGKVVIASKQHLAVLMPCGPALVLNLLRWGGEIRSYEDLKLPPSAAEMGIKPAELAMAKQLIDSMTDSWSADKFRDSYTESVMKLVEEKAQKGDVHQVDKPQDSPMVPTSNVVDLSELLMRSLRGQPGAAPRASSKVGSKPSAKPVPLKKVPAKKAGAPSRPRKAA
jgi:DNA end-binding protein Ku